MAESDRQLQMMQKRLREEELRILRGQAKVRRPSPCVGRMHACMRCICTGCHLWQVDERALDDALAYNDVENARAAPRPGERSDTRVDLPGERPDTRVDRGWGRWGRVDRGSPGREVGL